MAIRLDNACKAGSEGTRPANILESLAKARHPAAKPAAQAPAKQEVAKKRGCSAGKPVCMRTNEEENASLRRGASALPSLRNSPTKKQRSAEGPRALPLQPISAYKRRGEAARAQSLLEGLHTGAMEIGRAHI